MRKPLALALAVAITLAGILFVSRPVREEGQPLAASSIPLEGAKPADPGVQLAGTVEPERARAPAAESPTSGASSQKSRLVVLVVSKKDRAPVARARVGVYKKGDSSPHLLTDIDGSIGDFDHRPGTGVDGHVELVLDPGIEYLVRALGDPIKDGSASEGIPALSPGETRTLTIEIPSLVDLHVFGQVVADEGGAPIEGARVLVSYDSTRDVKTDSEGKFDVELTLWRRPFLEIEAKGFGPTYVVPGGGHGSADDPIVIRLVRSATLIARIVDRAGRGIGSGSVRLTAEGYELTGPEKRFTEGWDSLLDVEWSRKQPLDGEGICRFEDLPPNVPLKSEISVPEREAKRDEAPLSLLPGQVLEREWVLGAGCRLTGRVLDPNSSPVQDVEIWLVKWTPGAMRRFDRFSIEAKERRTRSGQDGTFEFDDVEAGSWLIGPGPDDAKKSIAPFPEVVEIPAEASDVVHDVRIFDGLYIRGRVVDSKDEPVRSHVYVSGKMEGTNWFVEWQGKGDGHFELGPLVPGRYRLGADATGGQDAASEEVTATAGDADLILKLLPGRILSGKVLDARTGAPCSAELVIAPHGSDRGNLWMARSKQDGTFHSASLPNGIYDISASTDDGCFGQQLEIVVRSENESADAVVSVSPGAKLLIRYEAASGYGQMHVRYGGSYIAADGIAAGSTRIVVVPAGHVVVELMTPPQSQEVDLAVGEEKTVALTGPK